MVARSTETIAAGTNEESQMDEEVLLNLIGVLNDLGFWTIVQVVVGAVIAAGLIWLFKDSLWPWRRSTKKERRARAKQQLKKALERRERWKIVDWKGTSIEERQIQQACWDNIRDHVVGICAVIVVIFVGWQALANSEMRRRVGHEIQLSMQLLSVAKSSKDARTLLRRELVWNDGVEPCSEPWVERKGLVDQLKCYERATMGDCEKEALEFTRCMNYAGWMIERCGEADTDCMPLHGRCDMGRINLRIDSDIGLRECDEREGEFARVHWRCQEEVTRRHDQELEGWWTGPLRMYDAMETYRLCALARGYVALLCSDQECREIEVPKAECEDEIIEWAEQYERPLLPECVAEDRRQRKESRRFRKIFGPDWRPKL